MDALSASCLLNDSQ